MIDIKLTQRIFRRCLLFLYHVPCVLHASTVLFRADTFQGPRETRVTSWGQPRPACCRPGSRVVGGLRPGWASICFRGCLWPRGGLRRGHVPSPLDSSRTGLHSRARTSGVASALFTCSCPWGRGLPPGPCPDHHAAATRRPPWNRKGLVGHRVSGLWVCGRPWCFLSKSLTPRFSLGVSSWMRSPNLFPQRSCREMAELAEHRSYPVCMGAGHHHAVPTPIGPGHYFWGFKGRDCRLCERFYEVVLETAGLPAGLLCFRRPYLFHNTDVSLLHEKH